MEEFMKLANLDCFNEIVIQMHDNPDADAVGSGYALYRYFESKGKSVRLIYGGRERIKKSNMPVWGGKRHAFRGGEHSDDRSPRHGPVI